jgi:DNA-binding IclR family transcriptional regulator
MANLPDKTLRKARNAAVVPDAPREDDGDAVDERYLVPALIRGLQVLTVMSEQHRRLTLSEIASALGTTRSSAYRLAYTLGHLGFLEYDPQRKTYALGPQVLHLGYGYLASRDLVEVAMPHLMRLRDRTGWSAHIGELQGRDVVYLARVATRRTIASTVHVGTRLPARMTTMGRVLLSGLPAEDVRELYRDDQFGSGTAPAPATVATLLAQLAVDRANGVVVQNSDYEPGVASVAAPIRDMTDRIVAAVNISAIALFTSDTELQGPLKAEVLAAADAISRDLGRKGEAGLAVGEPQ